MLVVTPMTRMKMVAASGLLRANALTFNAERIVQVAGSDNLSDFASLALRAACGKLSRASFGARFLVFSEAQICLSYTARGLSARTARAIALANSRGAQDAGRRSDNSPRSIGYRPIALLLSYGGMKWSPDEVNAPRSAGCEPAAFLLSYRANEAGTRTR